MAAVPDPSITMISYRNNYNSLVSNSGHRKTYPRWVRGVCVALLYISWLWYYLCTPEHHDHTTLPHGILNTKRAEEAYSNVHSHKICDRGLFSPRYTLHQARPWGTNSKSGMSRSSNNWSFAQFGKPTSRKFPKKVSKSSISVGVKNGEPSTSKFEGLSNPSRQPDRGYVLWYPASSRLPICGMSSVERSGREDITLDSWREFSRVILIPGPVEHSWSMVGWMLFNTRWPRRVITAADHHVVPISLRHWWNRRSCEMAVWRELGSLLSLSCLYVTEKASEMV